MKAYKIYRGMKTGRGAASQWQIADKGEEYGRVVFLEIAAQVSEAVIPGAFSFDWDRKITVKLDLADIGEILAVLTRRKNQLGNGNLYHENGVGNKIIILNRNQENKGYYLAVSYKKKSGEKTENAHHISEGEVCILTELLKFAVIYILECM